MILLESSLIRLDYDPATDILQVRYPDLDTLHLSEIKHSLAVMVETIRNYDVRKLLLDASKTTIALGEEENRQLTMGLAAELAKTRILKVARIQPANHANESRAQMNMDDARRAGLMPYEVRTFERCEEALAWLRQ